MVFRKADVLSSSQVFTLDLWRCTLIESSASVNYLQQHCALPQTATSADGRA